MVVVSDIPVAYVRWPGVAGASGSVARSTAALWLRHVTTWSRTRCPSNPRLGETLHDVEFHQLPLLKGYGSTPLLRSLINISHRQRAVLAVLQSSYIHLLPYPFAGFSCTRSFIVAFIVGSLLAHPFTHCSFRLSTVPLHRLLLVAFAFRSLPVHGGFWQCPPSLQPPRIPLRMLCAHNPLWQLSPFQSSCTPLYILLAHDRFWQLLPFRRLLAHPFISSSQDCS